MSKDLMNTKEVAGFLGVNEKQIYNLISEKGLPGTKVTGKWLFPRRLVEQWLDSRTINYPQMPDPLADQDRLLIIAGSNDILLDRAISLFNERYPDLLAVFGNLGSMGGLRAMRRNLCHAASSHLLQTDEQDYNFGFALDELNELPAVVNFCRREQGLLVAKSNPKGIHAVSDLGRPGVRIVNRRIGTGTRVLLDRELDKAGIVGHRIQGYDIEMHRHLDAGLEVLSGRADAAPAIRAVAGLLDLDFIPLRWERFDLLISKARYFDQGIQLFLGLLHEKSFAELAKDLAGYDLGACGKIVYPKEVEPLK
ncbi:MAG: helix-turn-helix transcriptional regulator [Desulfomonilaceae bacterium]|nr:helix-turn-helix transcriptional regulator [Desulfomonilaceae bacterium]